MAQRYNNSEGHTNKSFIYAVMQGLCGLAMEKSGCALVILDLDDVFPAAGETVGTGSLVEDEYVEVTVNRPFGM